MNWRKISKNQKPILPPRARIKGVVFHWSAGRYNQMFGDYHFMFGPNSEVYQNADAVSSARFATLPHTWNRNTGRLGLCAAAMFNAHPENYGTQPVTRHQVEAMAAFAAGLIRKYGIKLEECRTHEEWASDDGYGPNSGDPETRWDFWQEIEFDKDGKGVKGISATSGGDWLRRKIEWYLSQGKKG